MKKRSVLWCMLILALTALLTVPVQADTGPKPQLIVRVENAPQEPYYLDLLEEGEGTGGDKEGLSWSYSEEERAALDEGLLDALLAAVPEGYRACTVEGTGGAPMWGELAAEHTDRAGNPLHTFSYAGVPETYRILLVTKSGQSYLSPTLTRSVLQSSVTVDFAAGTVSAPPAALGYVLQFLATFLPTLFIEGVVLAAFGYSLRKSWRPFLLLNLVTQGALAAFLAATALGSGVSWLYFFLFFPAEVLIALVEAAAYTRLLPAHGTRRAFAYGLTANVCSAALGFFLAEPVWRWVVSIS